MIHFSSDHHLGDTRVISLMDRPFDSVEAHERALISRWNGAVAPDDTVYLLGDFALTEETITSLSSVTFVVSFLISCEKEAKGKR